MASRRAVAVAASTHCYPILEASAARPFVVASPSTPEPPLPTSLLPAMDVLLSKVRPCCDFTRDVMFFSSHISFLILPVSLRRVCSVTTTGMLTSFRLRSRR